MTETSLARALDEEIGDLQQKTKQLEGELKRSKEREEHSAKDAIQNWDKFCHARKSIEALELVVTTQQEKLEVLRKADLNTEEVIQSSAAPLKPWAPTAKEVLLMKVVKRSRETMATAQRHTIAGNLNQAYDLLKEATDWISAHIPGDYVEREGAEILCKICREDGAGRAFHR